MNKRRKEKKIICLLFALYIAVGIAVMFAFKTVLPFPAAEIAAAAYYMFTKGKALPGVLILLVILGLIYFISSVYRKSDIGVAGKIYSSVLCFVDFIIHIIVFFLSSGFQWNYLISAILDLTLLIVVLIGTKRKNTY